MRRAPAGDRRKQRRVPATRRARGKADRARAREIGRDHALAAALWSAGRYEARLLAAVVEDPAQVTVRQMNAWTADFESWSDCDTNQTLRRAAVELAGRLARSSHGSQAGIGRSALRELAGRRGGSRTGR
jgi:3-methyladenine DNA glycosylase AlkD